MRKDLFDWGRLMLLITLGFGFAMHMLAPEYRLEGSPGALGLGLGLGVRARVRVRVAPEYRLEGRPGARRPLGFGLRIGFGLRWQHRRAAPPPNPNPNPSTLTLTP